MKTIREQLEPGSADNESNGLDLCVQASIAVSLRRIADSLERGEGYLHSLAGELAHPEYGVGPSIRRAAKGYGR